MGRREHDKKNTRELDQQLGEVWYALTNIVPHREIQMARRDNGNHQLGTTQRNETKQDNVQFLSFIYIRLVPTKSTSAQSKQITHSTVPNVCIAKRKNFTSSNAENI